VPSPNGGSRGATTTLPAGGGVVAARGAEALLTLGGGKVLPL